MPPVQCGAPRPVRPPNEKTRLAASLTAEMREHIGKLREYRAALIAAAVTEQIDVRGEGETAPTEWLCYTVGTC